MLDRSRLRGEVKLVTERTVFSSAIGGFIKNLEDTKGPYSSHQIASKEGCPKSIGGIDKDGDSDHLDKKCIELCKVLE